MTFIYMFFHTSLYHMERPKDRGIIPEEDSMKMNLKKEFADKTVFILTYAWEKVLVY